MNKREQFIRGSVNGNGNEIFSIIREWYYRELNIIIIYGNHGIGIMNYLLLSYTIFCLLLLG